MHRYFFFVMLLCSPLFSQDSASIEQDVRAAMSHSLFRSQPITIEAAISAGGKQIGGYRLIWHSNEDWADRVDLKDQTSLTIAKGDRQYHRRNTPADHQWTYLVRNAFEPQLIWRGGSELKFTKSSKSKIEGIPVECAEFEAKP